MRGPRLLQQLHWRALHRHFVLVHYFYVDDTALLFGGAHANFGALGVETVANDSRLDPVSLVFDLNTFVLGRCNYDERTYAILAASALVAGIIFGDALVAKSGFYRVLWYTLFVPEPLALLCILQFDLLEKRRDSKIPIVDDGDFHYQWSVYQVALDAAYSLTFLFARDAWRSIKYRDKFLFLTTPVTVRVIHLGGGAVTSAKSDEIIPSGNAEQELVIVSDLLGPAVHNAASKKKPCSRPCKRRPLQTMGRHM